MNLKNILVPIDFSEASLAAIQAAEELATSDTTLTLLHVTPMQRFVILDWTYVPPPEEMVRVGKAADEGLKNWAAKLKLPRTRVRLDTVPGDPAAEIIKASARYDLVVIGTHGWTGVTRMILGSVAERVVRGAQCSVLVARDRKLIGG